MRVCACECGGGEWREGGRAAVIVAQFYRIKEKKEIDPSVYANCKGKFIFTEKPKIRFLK